MSWHSLRSAVQSYTKTKKMSKKQGLKWNGNAVVDFLNIYEKYKILWDENNENYLKKIPESTVLKDYTKSLNMLVQSCKFRTRKLQIKSKSNLHYTRRITPKRVTSCGAHLRGLAPGLHSSEETSQRWLVVGDTVLI